MIVWYEVNDGTESRTFEDWQFASACVHAEQRAKQLGREVTVERCTRETHVTLTPEPVQ